MSSPSPSRDVVVSARGLGQMYRLYARPQDRLKHALLWRFGRHWGHEFWALRDVSFEVRRGEMLGVIGRNGSGKSTLLQLVAGVLRPTAGEVRTCGRVGAVLELGSGFDPEFTGRENVFLNGAILGVPQAEMRRRFDEIAAFADIGEFVDQPVRVYSSGMYLRLAFAVTTSLDADVLLIDEALAVGDVFFRQKCYDRLAALRARGVAVILVSHDMSDVEQLCDRTLLLHRGTLQFAGPAYEAVRRYYLVDQEDRLARLAEGARGQERETTPLSAGSDAPWPPAEAFGDLAGRVQVANGWARCTGVAVLDQGGRPARVFAQGETASFCYEFELLADIEVPIGGMVMRNERGTVVHGKSTLEYGSEVPAFVPRGARLRFRQDVELQVAVGEYTFEVGLAAASRRDYAARRQHSHADLEARIGRICHLPVAGEFEVTLRTRGEPVQLLHHGAANLPGRCRVTLEPAPAAARAAESA